MRIAMIGQKGIPATSGGVERHVEELAKELTKMGHEILVYARAWYTPKSVKKYQNIKIIHTAGINTIHLDAITHTFTATIHAILQKPDVIHFHGVGPSLISWLPRLIAPRIKVVATFHSMDRYQYKWGKIAKCFLSLGEKFICLFPHSTITVSRGLYHYCLNQYHKITTYIPNGVPVWNGAKNEGRLEQWKLVPDQYLLTVCRVIKGKGIHYLISAWKTLRAQNPKLTNNLKLVIVGEGDENYLNELYALANGDESIVFTGVEQGENLNALFANSKLFIHPSENEGLPLSVLEAMSFGKAVMVSDIPAHQEIIRDSHFWFNTADIQSLANKITELITQPKLLSSAGHTNRETVAKHYSWKDIAVKTEKVYGSERNKE
ncbi:MAG: glycosyltransferase family 4 protein [Candidatus Magasanikbacteria bacterium]